MSGKTSIQWATHNWNPLAGCTPVSRGCDRCYAATLHNRRYLAWKQGRWPDAPAQYHQPFKVVQLLPDRLDDPLRWRAPRPRVFVNSMSDVFHEDVPDEFIARMFATMAAAKQHTFLVLTKRPERMASLLGGLGQVEFADLVDDAYERVADRQGWVCDVEVDAWPLPNVWLGTSVEDQQRADERIPHLIKTPAAVRFLSCEPLLGPVSLEPWLDNISNLTHMLGDWCPPPRHGDPETGWYHINDFEQPLHWVIVGGESGKGARPMQPGWADDLLHQCAAADIPYFFKQAGAVLGRAWGGRDPHGGDPDEWPDTWPRDLPGARS